MDYRRHPELIERLAAEYVLGTLHGRARARFARLMREDAVTRRAVQEWETRLSPMAEAVTAKTPPPRLWHAIAQRTVGTPAAASASAASVSFWDSLAFWRNWGLVASGFGAALVAVMATQEPQVVEVPVERIVEVPAKQMQAAYVATLRDKDGNVVMVAYAARNSDELWVKTTGTQALGPGQAFELWGLPAEKGAAPRSLGLLPVGDKGTIRLAAAADKTLSDVPALAISLEPAGGSKTGAPTGPVLYSGPCFKFW